MSLPGLSQPADCQDPVLYRRLYGEDPYRFFVLLPEDTFSGQRERELFQRDMEAVIPAGMTMQMIQLKPCIQLDWHTYLGITPDRRLCASGHRRAGHHSL